MKKGIWNLFLLLVLFSCGTINPSGEPVPVISSDTAQVSVPLSNVDSLNTKAQYDRAIADYLVSIKEQYRIELDTLVLGNHRYGQSDDFPEIELVEKIGRTIILLESPDEWTGCKSCGKGTLYVNLFSDIHASESDFFFVTFGKGMAHLFDVTLSYPISSGEMAVPEVSFVDYMK